LHARVVDYAERLLATYPEGLDRVFFTNSGSESNDLAFRIARQHTGARGILVSDFSYHGHTTLLAGITTGLVAREGLAPDVRGFAVPDLDAPSAAGRAEADVLADALADLDRAIDELTAAGHGVAAVILESVFSTEGLARVPAGFATALVGRVRRAGGLVIADEVQAGFGRTGSAFWGFQNLGIDPDLVTMGKPMGNGHPLGGVVTSAALQEEFGSRNMYFNTFGGNPVSAAAGAAVLDVIADEGLRERSDRLGGAIRDILTPLLAAHPRLGPVKGRGLFFGFDVFDRDAADRAALADPTTTRRIVEGVKARGVLLSRIGRADSVLKIRPPLAFDDTHVEPLVTALSGALDEVLAY
ncbi:aspartate aminotransferase family protein, partial [Microbacterium sp. Leaf351]